MKELLEKISRRKYLINIPTSRPVQPSISLEVLHALALRAIFDKLLMKNHDFAMLEEGIKLWTDYEFRTALDKWELDRIIYALIADENGYFNRTREIMTRENIHWKKMFKAGLPYLKSRTSWSKA